MRLAITACLTHLEGQTSPEASIRLISMIFVCYNTPFLGDTDSDVKNAKFFRGCPLRHCLCIQLAITACPTYLEGQTIPEASRLLISMIIVCVAHHFWVIWNPTSKMPNFFVDVHQDLVNAYGWASRLVRPIWRV